MISIVIPTYYEEKIIEFTLQSLKSQLTIPHEIIVSDGGSKDRTVEAAEKYADQVVVFTGAERQNIAQGRNEGARAARGEFLVFLDADCVLRDPDWFFRAALADFERMGKLVALTALLRVLPENETFPDRIIASVINAVVLFKNNILHKGEVPGGEFQMFRKEVFDKIGGYNEQLVTREDRDIFFPPFQNWPDPVRSAPDRFSYRKTCAHCRLGPSDRPVSRKYPLLPCERKGSFKEWTPVR